MNKMKRRKIYLFSGKYFEVERLIVERKSTEEVSRAACHSFSLHAFFLGGYIFAPLKKQGVFFIFWKGKRVNLLENVTSEQGVCFGLLRWIAKIKLYKTW